MKDPGAKGERVRTFFNAEASALIASYRNIEALIPSSTVSKGSAHPGEEGRYVENLLRSFLNRHLPGELRALSGFIVRPATKTGTKNKQRRQEEDSHSRQLDIIVYDVAHYPVYERFEEFAIVPPEGVIAIVSVKKTLYENQINNELQSLSDTIYLCRHVSANNVWVRGPYSALLAFSGKTGKHIEPAADRIFAAIQSVTGGKTFDRLIGQMGVLGAYTVFKHRPEPKTEKVRNASYMLFKHKEDEKHLGLQFLMTGILSTYHDSTRFAPERPGFTSFESHRNYDKALGAIPVSGLRCR